MKYQDTGMKVFLVLAAVAFGALVFVPSATVRGAVQSYPGGVDPHWFDPTLGSPAIGSGVPIPGLDTDFYGNPRDPLHPTIGAVEFGFVLPTVVPTIAAPTTIPTTVPPTVVPSTPVPPTPPTVVPPTVPPTPCSVRYSVLHDGIVIGTYSSVGEAKLSVPGVKWNDMTGTKGSKNTYSIVSVSCN